MLLVRSLMIVIIWSFATSPGSAATKVACVGDSITEGSGLGSPTTESYPARLQRLLGSDYQVRNFGVSGRTLLRQGDLPYWKEPAFTQSHDYDPDIVTIMLGTNDSKPYNWRYGTNFVTDYTDLIASYTNLPSHPRVLLCAPCPVFNNGAYDINPGIVATNIAPLVRELGATLGLEVIDLQVLLAGHKEWFPDNVHPNAKGATVLSALFRTALLGKSANTASAELALGIGNRTILKWPTEFAGWVPQSATSLRATNTTWTVVEQFSYNDGSLLRLTNTATGSGRVFRLWNPTP